MMKQNDLTYPNNPLVFFGVVEERIDDSYVRVRAFGFHSLDKGKISTEQLPPALVLYSTDSGHVSGGSLSHGIEVDSWVRGEFLDYPYCTQPIIIHVIRGGSYSMSSYTTGGGEFIGQGVDVDSNINPTIDEGATTNIPGDSNKQKLYNYVYAKLQNDNLSSNPHLHTSALCGVLSLETTNINPASVNPGRDKAWGICQWLGARRTQLFKRFGQTRRIDQQLDFMWWELDNTERNAKGKWLRATNLIDATTGFCFFERAEEFQNGRIQRGHPNFKKRYQYAQQFYNSAKYTG